MILRIIKIYFINLSAEYMENKKLTILFLGNIESPHTAKWVQYFANQGHIVHLASNMSKSGLICKTENVNLHMLKRKVEINVWPFNTLLNFPFTLAKIKRLIKETKPDIIHAHYATSYGHLAALTGKRPFVLTAWGSDILVAPKEHWLAKQIVKYVLKKADYITCDATHMKRAMVELGADGSKIEIINFGIDTKKFSPGDKNGELREKISFPKNSKIIISLRSLEPIYDIESLIRAIPEIIRRVSDAKFIIIGKGSMEDKLKKMTEDLCPKNSVKFLGRIENDDLPQYLRLSDVYVSTSLSDGGIAASTAEAMACGVPVVITDSADNRQWVNDEQNGFIIPIKSPEAIMEKVCFLLKDEALKEKIGKAGRKTIMEKNDYYKEMSKMESIYYKLLKS